MKSHQSAATVAAAPVQRVDEQAAVASGTPLRRQVLLGAGVLGAGALAARLLPDAPEAPVSAALSEAAPPAVTDEGYRLTEHIARYYATARV